MNFFYYKIFFSKKMLQQKILFPKFYHNHSVRNLHSKHVFFFPNNGTEQTMAPLLTRHTHIYIHTHIYTLLVTAFYDIRNETIKILLSAFYV